MRSLLPNHCRDWHFIVVEIIFLVHKIGRFDVIGRLFIYHAQCVNYVSNTTMCDNMEDYPEEEEHVQVTSAKYIMYFVLLYQLPTSLVGLFCGAWSDKVGRKWPTLMSPVGAVITFMCFALSTVVQSDMIYIPLILIGAGQYGFLGDTTAMALNSYVTDTSEQEERTSKISKLHAMSLFGTFAGSLLFGALLEVWTFTNIFCVLIAINGFCVFFTLAFMKNSLPPAPEEDDNDSTDDDSSAPAEDRSKSSRFEFPFHWNNVTDSLRVVIKPRENKGRSQLLVFFVTIMIHQTCKAGETNTLVLFVQASPLSMSKSWYGYLMAMDFACLGLAVFFLLPFLVKLFNLGDITLLLMGSIVRIIRLLIMSFSTKPWMVYLAVFIGCPSAMIVTTAKSIISKIVSADEVGKTFSLLYICEISCDLLGTLIFTNVYAVTFNFFRGMAFMCMAIMRLIIFFVLIYLAKDMKDQWRNTFIQNILYGKKTSKCDFNNDEEAILKSSNSEQKVSYEALQDEYGSANGHVD